MDARIRLALGLAMAIVFLGGTFVAGSAIDWMFAEKPYTGPTREIETRCFQDALTADGKSKLIGVRYIETVRFDDPRPSISYLGSEHGCIDMDPTGFRKDTGGIVVTGLLSQQQKGGESQP